MSSISSYQNGGIIIFGPFANLISNFKGKSPVFSSNADFISYHSFCKIRVLVLLCFHPSYSQPLSSYLIFILLWFITFAISSVTIVNLPVFSVAWFKDLKARDKPLRYGRRADPCGTQQSHFPRPLWIPCDAWQRSTFLTSYLSGSSTNYDTFQIIFVHDFNHHQFQRFSLPESSVWDRFCWLLSRLAAQLSWFGTSVS